jgi:hypothetical protein
MQRIEDIIKKNKEAFSENEPREGHLDRFSEKLTAYHRQKESWFERYAIAIRIAAAVVLFIAVATLIFTDRLPGIKNLFTQRLVSSELPMELVEVMQYYNIVTDKKVSQIDELAVSTEEASRVKEKAMTELKALEESTTDLENEYAQNPNNERIINALLLNQREKAKILDKILNTLSQTN